MNFWTQMELAIVQRAGVPIPAKIMAKFQPQYLNGTTFGQTLAGSAASIAMPMPPALPTDMNDATAVKKYNDALQSYNTQMQAYRNQMIQQQLYMNQQAMLQRQQSISSTPPVGLSGASDSNSFPSYLT